jgi:hypothetical protein
MTARTHAVVFGSPLSNLRFWCGCGLSGMPPGDFMAGRPEVVDCEECLRLMKKGSEQLAKWSPHPALEVLGSLTDAQRAYLVEHCTAIAEHDEQDVSADDPLGSREPAMTADAHRKIAKLMEALNG